MSDGHSADTGEGEHNDEAKSGDLHGIEVCQRENWRRHRQLYIVMVKTGCRKG